MLATIVDWAALGKVVVYAFAGAIVLTVLFTTGVLLVEADDGRRPPSPAGRPASSRSRSAPGSSRSGCT